VAQDQDLRGLPPREREGAAPFRGRGNRAAGSLPERSGPALSPGVAIVLAVSRYRLYPSAEQEAALLRHCSGARYVWNLGQEQRAMYRPGRGPTPGFAEQCRQLTGARRAEPWLAAGSVNVQQQALRDLDQAWRNFFAGTHRRPAWRKRDRHEGFRITDFTFGLHGRKLNRRWSQVKVTKVGWVRFRRSRNVPECKSYRITRDRAGHWHVAFAVIPPPVEGPGTGQVTGIDRGVAVSLALADGEMYQAPGPVPRAGRLTRRLSRAKRGSNQRQRAKARLARARARDAHRRKDWAEKTSTSIARRFDLIRIEDLRVPNMTRKPAPKPDPERPGAFLPNGARAKAGLNRGILTAGWNLFAQRLEQKAPGRVEKVQPAYTSQRCSACGHVAAESRKSQALFACVACTYTGNADVNAARNIAAGHAVTAGGGPGLPEPVNREPLVGTA
jgi:putative transposase